MILCLDVGNSQIYGGVFEQEKVILRFRRATRAHFSSDELGIFLRSVIRENGISPNNISEIALCSVVPEVQHSLRNACSKYFEITPFILRAGVKTGLRIRYRNPLEVGADRIANSIAAIAHAGQRNLIVVDFGTATTFDVISSDQDYLGGLIIPGIRLSMEVLEAKTSKLPSVEIIRPGQVIGRSTTESIQAGLFFSHCESVTGIINRIANEQFDGQKPYVVGTGGFANLFDREVEFDKVDPDLVFHGLLRALKMNSTKEGT